MSFALSTFTLDIDGKPVLVLRTKWQAAADDYCRAWIQAHWEELTTKGPYGADLPPAIRLRMARATERAAYESKAESAELFHDVSVVMLRDVAHLGKSQAKDNGPVEDSEHLSGDDDQQIS